MQTNVVTPKIETTKIDVDDLIRRAIKLVDIAYTTGIQFVIAFYISTFIDYKFVGEFSKDKMDKTSTFNIFTEIIVNYALIGVLTYFARNLIEKIWFPLDGIRGFSNKRVKEVINPTLFSAILVANQKNLLLKTSYLYTRITSSWADPPPSQTKTMPTMSTMLTMLTTEENNSTKPAQVGSGGTNFPYEEINGTNGIYYQQN